MILIVTLLIAIIIFTFVYYEDQLLKSVTNRHRGTKTERKLVMQLLKAGFPKETIFHDLYLETRNGHYSQIDLVLATKVGIIVFEVKDYSGWIFGTGHHRKWTKILAYGQEKYSFYNPILQNKTHVDHIKSKLGQFQNVPFYSVVVFYGDCTFKDISFIPKNAFLVKSRRVIHVVKKIIQEGEPAIYQSKRAIVNLLSQAVLNGENPQILSKHTQNINEMLGTDRIFH